jgi:hypothetical protein
MFALLATLIISYRRLGVGRTPSGAIERWCVDAPCGLYLGWISVATIANAADVLWINGWDAWGIAPQVWTVTMLGVATTLGAVMVWRRRDVIFPLVLVWAFVGIADRQSGRFALPDAELVVQAAWIAAGASLLLAVVAVGLRRRAAAATRP